MSNGARIQARGDFHYGPAALWIALQAVAHNVEEKSGQCVRHKGFLRGGARGSGEMLRQGFDERNAERPDVARGRNDSLGNFRRVVRTRMAEAGGGAALRGFGGRPIRRFGERGNAVARELELIFDGENVGGPQVSVNEVFAVEKSESVQRGGENVARFGGSERALPKKLREIFLGVFHQDVE